MARMMAASMINTDFIRKHPAQAVLTVLGLSGVMAVFLPVVEDYVPVEYFFEQLEMLDPFGGLALIVGPFVVLPFFISAGYLRWLLTGGLSRWEGWVGYALALIVVVPFLLTTIQGWWESMRDWLFFAVPVALGLGAGAWFIVQNLRHQVRPGYFKLTALVAMQLAYLPFALFWLQYAIIVSDSGEAYLAFSTVFVYTAQAALSVRGQPWLLLRLLPLGLVWAGGLAAGILAS